MEFLCGARSLPKVKQFIIPAVTTQHGQYTLKHKKLAFSPIKINEKSALAYILSKQWF